MLHESKGHEPSKWSCSENRVNDGCQGSGKGAEGGMRRCWLVVLSFDYEAEWVLDIGWTV